MPGRIPTFPTLLALCAGVLGGTSLQAQATAPSDLSFTVDSRLFDGPSPLGARQLALDLAGAGAWPGQSLVAPGEPGLSLRNVGRGLSVFLGGALVGTGVQFGFHELGHGSRAAAVGYRAHYGRGSPAGVEAILADRRNGALTTRWIPFALKSVFEGGGGYTAVFDDDLRFPLLTEELDAWLGPTAMAGVNFEMFLAEGVEERALDGGVSTGMLALYASSKLAIRTYNLGDDVLNDIGNILDYYARTGVAVSYDDLRRGSLTSLLGSGLFYQMMLQLGRSFVGGDTGVAPVRLGGFSLPNTSYYLNASGTSFRVTSSWRRGRVVVPFGVELPQSGDPGTEFSLGVGYDTGRWGGTAHAFVGDGFAADLEGRYALTDRIDATMGYARMGRSTLAGARVVRDLRPGGQDEWFAGLRVRLDGGGLD